MKTLIRSSALAAALSLSVLAAGHGIVTNGNCHILCFNSTTHMGSSVTVFTSETQCCSTAFNPCPAGTSPLTRTFAPNGAPQLCGPIR
jgi:hypothetical protein